MSVDRLSNPASRRNGAAEGPQAPGAGPGWPESPQLEEWHKAHGALLAQERAFADLVTRHAMGQAAREELQDARQALQAVRDLADAVLQKALASLAVEQPGASSP